MKENVIAIDGHAYVGKSQIARALAKLTGHPFINTGHMYRAISKVAMKERVEPHDFRPLIVLAEKIGVRFEEGRTLVDGEDWTEGLDNPEIVRFSSKIAAIPEIREILTGKQRAYAHTGTIIMEGRDIGTIVFPNAKWKFFVTASPEIRARRMYKLTTGGEGAPPASVAPVLLKKMIEIDAADENRSIAPLRKADNAIEYDNSESPSAELDAQVLLYCMEELSKKGTVPPKITYKEWTHWKALVS